MKSEKLLRSLGGVSDELIDEAMVPRRHPLVRLAALAACVLVLLVGMYPFLRGMGDSGDASVPGVTFHGALYELWDDGNNTITDRLELPVPIGGALIGEQVGSLPDYGDIYAYAPLAGKNGTVPAALYLLYADGDWQYMVFTGFYTIGNDNDYVEAETLLQVYGILEPEDIVSVTHDGETLDAAAFYERLIGAEAMGSADYGEMIVSGAGSQAEEEALYEAAQEGVGRLRLQTAGGLVAWMEYYPATGYLRWNDCCFEVGNDLFPTP